MAVPIVNEKLLGELEAMGFPLDQAIQALNCSGNASLGAAVNWIIDHENASEMEQISPETMDIDIESPKPFDITEEMRRKSQELRDRARKKREETELKMERGREKERIRAGKELLEVKRIAEENERKRNIASQKTDREEQKQARDKIIRKLEADKAERRRMLGLPMEGPPAVKSNKRAEQEKRVEISGTYKSTTTTAEQMRECLRSLKRNHKDDDARVRRAFQTLLVYVGNIARNPDVEKFRRIRLGNPLFQERVGSVRGGVDFLELCGFETSEDSEFLYLPRDKVDMTVLYSAGTQLKSAITNPFFGVF